PRVRLARECAHLGTPASGLRRARSLRGQARAERGAGSTGERRLAAGFGNVRVRRLRLALEPALLVRGAGLLPNRVEAGVPIEGDVVLDVDLPAGDAAADLPVVLVDVHHGVRGIHERVQLAVVLRERDRVHAPVGGEAAGR